VTPAPTARGVARLPRPRGKYFSVHRRRFARAVLQRWEGLAWLAAMVLVVVTGALVVQAVGSGAGSARVTARFQAPVATASSESPCFLDGCSRQVLVGSPVRVRIPAIAVDSGLEELTLDASGKLNAPVAYEQAGWYRDGVIPGDPGPAVIAGHVDSVRGPAVFYRLHELVAGDAVTVLRGGVWVTFRVTSVERYAKDEFPAERVYRPTPEAELRLITCGGDFDPTRLSYRDNIVVYAVIE
jgi:LPXTG-site transpeptidase (sortase) family protein